jgi:hypothetical protein
MMEYETVTTKGNTKHGKCYTKIYGVWHGIKQRCFDKNRPEYERYGGRGITMFVDWLDFETFYKWAIENGYKEGLSIDRIDNDGNYEPSNCRWSTRKEQQNNTRYNHYIEINGVSKTITEWAKENNIRVDTFWLRVKKGWVGEKLLTPPMANKQRNMKKIRGKNK